LSDVVLRIACDRRWRPQRVGLGRPRRVHRRRRVRPDSPVAANRLVVQRQRGGHHRRVHRARTRRVPARSARRLASQPQPITPSPCRARRTAAAPATQS